MDSTAKNRANFHPQDVQSLRTNFPDHHGSTQPTAKTLGDTGCPKELSQTFRSADSVGCSTHRVMHNTRKECVRTSSGTTLLLGTQGTRGSWALVAPVNGSLPNRLCVGSAVFCSHGGGGHGERRAGSSLAAVGCADRSPHCSW